MIATTIIISTNVNPRRPFLMVCIRHCVSFAAVNDAEGLYIFRTLVFTNCLLQRSQQRKKRSDVCRPLKTVGVDSPWWR
jgi:hypothetical protein